MRYLSEGQIVEVIAPGYPCLPEEIKAGVQFLDSWGLEARFPKDIVGKHFLHSQTDEKRFAFLKQALLSEDSNVIWSLRGGYGSNRLLPYLAKMKKPKKKKLFIGISDVTSLHHFFIQEWGWQTLHGPLLDRMGKNLLTEKHQKELKGLLFGESEEIRFSKLKPLNSAAKETRSIEASVIGGNLTVLQGSLGTPFQFSAGKKILFVEDWGERGYRIDRIFEQFRQAGVFKKCAALVLGDFLGGVEPKTGKNNFDLVFKRWAQDLEIPVFSGLEAGHGEIQRPVPMGTKAVLAAVEKAGRKQFVLDIQNVRMK